MLSSGEHAFEMPLMWSGKFAAVTVSWPYKHSAPEIVVLFSRQTFLAERKCASVPGIKSQAN